MQTTKVLILLKHPPCTLLYALDHSSLCFSYVALQQHTKMNTHGLHDA
jgi:hypothetical protein